MVLAPGLGAFAENAAAVFERSQSMGGAWTGGLGVSRGAYITCSAPARPVAHEVGAGPEWLLS